jgi:acetate kinase
MAILVRNAGSSSLKFALIDNASGQAHLAGNETLGAEGLAAALERALAALPQGVRIAGIGHRVVHGGERFTGSALIDSQVVAAIESCIRLAPLHNPANLAGIVAAQRRFPDLPQVAVFDTAFHQTMPEVAWRYAVPAAWQQELGVRRYGFHGTSHRYVAARLRELLPTARRVVTAHLGNGCSACAIRDGRSIDTTMGLTPLEGLVMGTRSGDLDPGILPYVAQVTGRPWAELAGELNCSAGLRGLSTLTHDMQALLAARAEGHDGAAIAVAVFCYRLAKAIAALCVPLRGLDALVFTGGIGEHASSVRAETVALLGYLGLRLDESANASTREGPLAADRRVWVIPTNEELLIARDTAEIMVGGGEGRSGQQGALRTPSPAVPHGFQP